MMAVTQFNIVHEHCCLSHTDACRLFDIALRQREARMIVLDLKWVRDASTSAFARLVLLRRMLLKTGRDLKLVNLTDRAAHLYGIEHLDKVLPCA